MAFSVGSSVGSGYTGKDPNIRRQMAQRVQEKAQVRSGAPKDDFVMPSKAATSGYEEEQTVKKVSASRGYWAGFFERLMSGEEIELAY